MFFFRDRCVGTNLGTWYAVQQPQTREATPASLPPNVLQALYLCPSVCFFVFLFFFLVIYHSLVEKAQKNSRDPKIGTKINPKMVPQRCFAITVREAVIYVLAEFVREKKKVFFLSGKGGHRAVF